MVIREAARFSPTRFFLPPSFPGMIRSGDWDSLKRLLLLISEAAVLLKLHGFMKYVLRIDPIPLAVLGFSQ